MMEIMSQIKKTIVPKPYFSKFCLDNIRFKKLLEDSGRLIKLFEDGKEKLNGEYIFDLHYVTSLIEEITDLLDKIVLNASVLSIVAIEPLFNTLDNYKEAAKEIILSADSLKKVNRPHKIPLSSLSTEPEFQILSIVTGWFDGTPGNQLPPIKVFMAEILSYIMDSNTMPLEEGVESEFTCNGILNRVNSCFFYDTKLLRDKDDESYKDLNPLALLTDEIGVDKDQRSKNIVKTNTWSAFLDHDYLSLVLWNKDDPVLRIDSCIEGLKESDFIFICSKGSIDITQIIDENFHVFIDKTSSFAWCSSLSAANLKKSLNQVGTTLFKNNIV